VDPETRISFLFARYYGRTQPRCGVDPSVGRNYTSAARAGTVVGLRPVAAAAADDDDDEEEAALGKMLIEN